MDGEASLETLAEVAIALAGFGSLLVVLRRSPTSPWSEGEGADLLIVVGGSLLVLFFSLLPLPLYHLGLPAERAWRASSLLFALALLAAYAVVFRRRRMLLRQGIRASFPRLSGVLAQLPLLLVAGLGLQGFAGLAGAGVGLYLLALVLLLAGAAFPLMSLVMRLGKEGDAAAVSGEVASEPPRADVGGSAGSPGEPPIS
jgi:hypothetical protein